MNIKHIALLSCLALTACGETRMERAGSGAIIGGTTGAVVGLVCCGDPIDGATAGLYIGAASGALIGALLDEPLFMDYREE